MKNVLRKDKTDQCRVKLISETRFIIKNIQKGREHSTEKRDFLHLKFKKKDLEKRDNIKTYISFFKI